MNKTDIISVAAVVLLTVQANTAKGQYDARVMLDVDSTQQLSIPALSAGKPMAGRRVIVTPPEYAGTEVYHTVYLPDGWTPEWKKTGMRLPIIFEYTGNWFPKSGSTGEVEDAGLGYGLSGGRYIWVSLPYISQDHTDNEITWWGDEAATIQYAKLNVPRIIEQYGADPSAVFLCGFSRGAIAVNYIGLHDDEVSNLWTAFITHDHFDGVKEWPKTAWGMPLSAYRKGAAERLNRVGGRPYLVSQNGKGYGSEAFIRSVLSSVDNFTFCYVDTQAIFGGFPNEVAKGGHTDRWPLKPSEFRTATWRWMNGVTENRFENVRDLNWTEVFHDPCTGDWQEQWTLDGLKAKVTNSGKGMEFWAGPTPKSNADHAVMWTKESFAGDIRIDYEYTKLDSAEQYVTILYIQATGYGEGPYAKDISQWASMREVPAMRNYFDFMHSYHISYAAYGADLNGLDNDYIHARRYMPGLNDGMRSIDFKPKPVRTGLFAEGILHRITMIKKGGDLFMHVRNEDAERLYRWTTITAPPVLEGRVGLRHMWTRGAVYRDFRVSLLRNDKEGR